MSADELTAIKWFCPKYPVEGLPLRKDGSVDFEVLCGEFLVEGAPIKEVKADYDRLPLHLKRIL